MDMVKLASGIELAVWDSGPKDAPALIFLHGFPESHRSWRHQIAHFEGHCRCIAPDQRGYGQSSKPRAVKAYATEKLIADVFELASALGVEKFTVVGHDWGGVIAWSVALMDMWVNKGALRVTRAIIANAPHPVRFQKLLWLDPAQRQASQYIRAFRDPANDALVSEHGLGALLAKVVKWERSPVLEPEERDAQLADWQDRDAAFGMLNWYRASVLNVPAMDAPFALPEDWREPSLPPIAIPALVIWAMEDKALLPANLDGLDRMVPDLAIVRIPDCGHFVQWEKPAQVNAAIEAFLGRTRS